VDVLSPGAQQFLTQSIEHHIVRDTGEAVHSSRPTTTHAGSLARVAEIRTEVVETDATGASVESCAVAAGRLTGVAGLVDLVVSVRALGDADG
jgi:hypothetical protein